MENRDQARTGPHRLRPHRQVQLGIEKLSDTKYCRPGPSVLVSGEVSTEAKRMSFHASRKENTNVTAMPGSASGSVTCRMTRQRLAPATIACCSSSTGRLLTETLSSQVAKASANVMEGRTRPH